MLLFMENGINMWKRYAAKELTQRDFVWKSCQWFPKIIFSFLKTCLTTAK